MEFNSPHVLWLCRHCIDRVDKQREIWIDRRDTGALNGNRKLEAISDLRGNAVKQKQERLKWPWMIANLPRSSLLEHLLHATSYNSKINIAYLQSTYFGLYFINNFFWNFGLQCPGLSVFFTVLSWATQFKDGFNPTCSMFQQKQHKHLQFPSCDDYLYSQKCQPLKSLFLVSIIKQKSKQLRSHANINI